MSGSIGRRAARAATAPVRGYLNQHFEMVKAEVRSVAAREGAVSAVVVDDSASWERVAELENTIAELSLYQTRVLNRVTDEVAGLTDRIDDLDRIVRQLAAVVGASHDRSINAGADATTDA